MEDIAADRGLDFLLSPGIADPDRIKAGLPLLVDINLIDRNPDQPREYFDEKEISSLARSIKTMGVIDPLTVRPKGDGRYELVDGERRLKAAAMVNLEKIPVFIREKSEDPAEGLRLALVHNLCREDLNPIEEAEAFGRLEKEFSQTHQQIAEMVGRERSTVTNSVRLLKLPEYIKDDIRYGRLTPGHGRALLALVDKEFINDIRNNIITKKMPVRQVENIIKRLNKKNKTTKPLPSDDQAYYEALATAFSRQLQGLKVKIGRQGRAGKLEIFYSRQDELEWLMTRLGVKNF
ncbi:MAG: ParB/RepB/Spo0J family partition protein [Candidatus Adiutrix sp.]|nr:ParB/RepB/Spo0J family partition protein [Candidatus Adiutrix sp.]